jgi:hypothetical protein
MESLERPVNKAWSRSVDLDRIHPVLMRRNCNLRMDHTQGAAIHLVLKVKKKFVIDLLDPRVNKLSIICQKNV